MSMALLGEHFDLHTGGIDHRELHHVNEIAQSEAYLHDGRPWVKFWLHNEFLLIDNAKIAKSSGPVPRLADLVESGYHPMAYRLFLLGGHYRSQLDFTMSGVDAAQATLRRLVTKVAPLHPLPQVTTLAHARDLLSALGTPSTDGPSTTVVGSDGPSPDGPNADTIGAEIDDKAALAFLEAIDDAISSDLATPRLLATLQEALRDPLITRDGLRVVVAAADALLGLTLSDLTPDEVDQRRSTADLAPEVAAAIERLLAERTQARKEKNWPRADEIRTELDTLGVQVTDTPSGPTWTLR
jgi:cysteinyl-tRNA synthetase